MKFSALRVRKCLPWPPGSIGPMVSLPLSGSAGSLWLPRGGVNKGILWAPCCSAWPCTVARIKMRMPTECHVALDFVVFYLDDGIVAGPAEAVAWFSGSCKASWRPWGCL